MAEQTDAYIYQRGKVWWTSFAVNGHRTQQSLRLSDRRAAQRKANELREAAKARDQRSGTHKHWQDVIIAWAQDDQASNLASESLKRYATSFKMLEPFFGHMMIRDIGKQEINAYVLARKAEVTVSTIKNDLIALSQLLAFADEQDWRDGNPAKDKLARLKPRRDPFILPLDSLIEAVLDDCVPDMQLLAKAALLTGARQEELCKAKRTQLKGIALTLIGKRRRKRVVELSPEAQALFAQAPRHITSPYLIPHEGREWTTASIYFSKRVARLKQLLDDPTGKFKRVRPLQNLLQQKKVEFTPFCFHDLRHIYAIRFLQNGGNIYTLQRNMGHRSIKTTEIYLEHLTAEEQAVAKGEARTSSTTKSTTGNRFAG